MSPDKLPYMTTHEVAERLGVTRQRVQQLIKTGALKAHALGSAAYLVADAEVDRLLEQRALALEKAAHQLRKVKTK